VDEAGRAVSLRFNSAGFRGPDWSRGKPAHGLRVAVLGDSMTAAIATEEERTFVHRLEASLGARRPGQKVEVMNVGVSSASTGAELVTWRRVLEDHAPDLVLLAFFTGNDFGDNCSRLTKAPRVYFELEGETLVEGRAPAPTPAVTRWLDLHSRLYVWQKVAFRQLRGSTRAASGGIEPGQRIFAQEDGPDVEYAWRVTEALVRQLHDEVTTSKARFALVVIPCAEQVDDALWADLERRGRAAGHRLFRDEASRRLAGIAERSGVPVLDLTSSFGEEGRGSARNLYLLGRFHLSDLGNRVAADALHAYLVSRPDLLGEEVSRSGTPTYALKK
jgi:lysophospholipase L1-like esterase